MKEENKVKRYWLYLFGIVLFSVFFVGCATKQTIYNQDMLVTVFQSSKVNFSSQKKRVKPKKIVAKGLYLTAYSAGSSKKLQQTIELINATELNAIVIDIKDASGYVLYDSNVPLVNALELEDNRLGDVEKIIETLHENNIYVIARQTVFQDPVLAKNKPEWAIKHRQGGLWKDHKGLAWVDPTIQDVWEYNAAIAKEAIALGFDEINFDYVRFPSDGNMRNVVYTTGDQEKYAVMGDFFHFLDKKLSHEPAWISIDMFGFVMERHDGMTIGQRLQDAVDHIDYICPMMYPSHYPSGHLGLINPAAEPGKVIENGMKMGVPHFTEKRAIVRPWIQAFNIGAVYDAQKIREQIVEIEKYPEAGWLLWNAANRYSSAGITPSN
ncbi:MAG: GTP-binding protein [Candidatus Magasanikbacteria bacterium]|nr:GTP-binding protein [Candidatus Magasanikbacteria bacterium]|tara:strand:+ start:7846 stop:8988 length:1143 start_codon:yes stop_codon:yes gene_type:complete